MTNREIKFNIFDKLQERMWLWDEVGAELLNAALQGSERYLPLQWTGLKDSAGVEIYEGDIVQFRCYDQKHDDLDEGVAVVEFGRTVMNSQYTYGYCLNLSDCKQGKFKPSGFHRGLDHGSLKILGNVFQHPNLLNNQPKQ